MPARTASRLPALTGGPMAGMAWQIRIVQEIRRRVPAKIALAETVTVTATIMMETGMPVSYQPVVMAHRNAGHYKDCATVGGSHFGGL
jgi:hypothetical protein